MDGRLKESIMADHGHAQHKIGMLTGSIERYRAFALLILCCFFGSTLKAGKFNVELQKAPGSDNFVLSIQDNNSADLMISILNVPGKVIFQESIRYAEQLKKVYNLSSLKKGEYRFRVTSGNDIFDKPIIVQGVHKPHPGVGKNILVGFSSLSKDKHIEVVIQNKTGKVVLLQVINDLNKVIKKEQYGVDALLKKSINLSSLGDGNYKIRIICQGNVFYKDLKLI